MEDTTTVLSHLKVPIPFLKPRPVRTDSEMMRMIHLTVRDILWSTNSIPGGAKEQAPSERFLVIC